MLRLLSNWRREGVLIATGALAGAAIAIAIVLAADSNGGSSNTAASAQKVEGRSLFPRGCFPAPNVSAPVASLTHHSSPYLDPVRATSPANTYGKGCSAGYFVVEATETGGWRFRLAAIWGDTYGGPPPSSKSECEGSRVSGHFFGYDRRRWHRLSSRAASGVWKPEGSCSTPVVSHELSIGSPYSAIRVIASARSPGRSKKVTASIDNVQW